MTLAPTLKCNMAAEIPAPRNFKLWLILILSVDLITKKSDGYHENELLSTSTCLDVRMCSTCLSTKPNLFFLFEFSINIWS